MGKQEDQKLAALVRKNAAKVAGKKKKEAKHRYDPTLSAEPTEEDLERRDFFREMKKREF